MFLSLILSWLARPATYSWSPSLDLSDNEVYSTLLPGGQV